MRTVAALALVFTLAACGGGPDEAALRADVAERLAQSLPAGTVTLAALQRRGSQGDAKAPAGEKRRVVYFDADISLERDFDFGAWDSPGVAGLISALGAGPKGIKGITAGGNKAGDVIRAHGTAVYKRDGERWAAVSSGGVRSTAPPAYATDSPPEGAAAMLDSVRKVVDSVPRDASPAERAIIEEELGAARAAIRSRIARAKDGYAIAAGPERGQYLRLAQALAQERGSRLFALVTRGGEDNLRMLRDGKVPLAFAQGDSALDAYEGRAAFASDGPFTSLRAVGSLYPEPVHVLVRSGSAFATVEQLKGRRVAIGEHGSASRTTALRVLEAHGLGQSGVQAAEVPLGEALVMLRAGKVDAVIQVIGLPSDSVRDALAQITLRMVPLSARAISTLAASKSGYFAYTVAPGTYATQKAPVATIATAALLVVGGDMSQSEVASIARFVFTGGRDLAARGSAQGTLVSAASARQALPIPLHNGSAQALDAVGRESIPGPAGKL